MADMQIVLAGKKIEPQHVEMNVPLYSYGCEKKIRKALSRLRGIHSVHVDYHAQKVTVWGICNRDDVLTAIRRKRRDAYFWDEPESKIAPSSTKYDGIELGIHSVHVDYHAQKVTVWGICNRDDVLTAIRRKRRDAYFWDEPESKIAPSSTKYDGIELGRSSRLAATLTVYKFRKSWKKLFPLVLY